MSEECEGDITSRVREIRRQYEGEFDPKEYHATYYHTLDEEVKFFLKCYHDAFNTESLLTGRSPRQRRLLEFGCGPVPVYAAAAAYYTASLTMCEILPKNREELQAWMEGGEEALDWTPFFTYLASLMPPRNGEEVAERLRDVFQLVLPCDLTQREPLSPIRQKYDVIMTTLCVEFTSWSTEDYQELVGRVVTLLKPGGVLLMAGALGNTSYTLGRCQYPSVSLQEGDIRDALTALGLRIASFLTLERQTSSHDKPADHKGVFFLVAQSDTQQEVK